jgi:hypothetical protein
VAQISHQVFVPQVFECAHIVLAVPYHPPPVFDLFEPVASFLSFFHK